MPSAVVIDPDNGDIFVSDGYGNRRVIVFDKDGKFLRQWGRQATDEETQKAVPGVFAEVVHCIAMSNAGLVYVCDRQGNRVQVFRKDGTFVRNISIRTIPASCRTSAAPPGGWRSRPTEQRSMYVMNGGTEQVTSSITRAVHPVELRPAGSPDPQLHPRPHHHGRLRRAASTWRRPIGAGGFRNSGLVK